MDAALQFRSRQVLETEDIAADFIENEVGRHDWANNWPRYKAKGDLRKRIARWLINAGYDSTPEAVEQAIDRMLLTQPGRWR